MSRNVSVVLVLGLVLAGSPVHGRATGPTEVLLDAPSDPSVPGSVGGEIPGELVVTYRPSTTSAERRSVRALAAASVTQRAGRLEVLRVAPAEAARALEALRADPAVLAAEPNRRFAATGTFPIDPNITEQWGVHNVEQFGFGTTDADIDAPEAWDLVHDAGAVVVAVVDTGVELDHPDLEHRLWSNTDELANGIDDDGNGYIDDTRGWDWVGWDDDPSDLNGHGTHVAGTIGAQGGNGQGVAGVAWDVQLMPLRVLDEDGVGSMGDVALAFRYAGENGAHVVNASLGSRGGTEPESLRAAIADHPQTLYVVAAGNDGVDVGETPTWPCAIDLANLVCVTASDESDARPAWANTGRKAVDLAAPGVDVLSTSRSMAAAAEGSLALAESPDGFYRNDTNSWARLDQELDLSASEGCALTWDLLVESQYGDRLHAEASTGSGWTKLWSASGSTGGVHKGFTASLSSFEGSAGVRVRFRFDSGSTIVYDGAHIDNVDVTCADGDPGVAIQTFEGGLAGWTTGGTKDGWSVTDSADQYEYMSGTSMATPFVAGASALLWSLRPAEVEPEEWRAHIVNVLRGGADRARRWMKRHTRFEGRLNLFRSVSYAGDLVAPPRPEVRALDRFQGGRRFRVRSKGSDPDSGLRSFDIRFRQADHDWRRFSSTRRWRSDVTAPRFKGKQGRTYCFNSRARDNAFNAGSWSGRECTSVPVNDRKLDRSGAWKKGRHGKVYLDTFLKTRKRGAVLKLRDVRARELVLVATTCRDCGRVRVFKGRTRLRTIDLGRAFERGRQIRIARFTKVRGPRTIRIKVISRGKPVRIEGLGVSRI